MEVLSRTGSNATARTASTPAGVLGIYPDVSLEQARKLAAHYVVEGKPPTEDQMADLMSAVRHAISAVTVSPPATATVEVKVERHPDSFRRLFTGSVGEAGQDVQGRVENREASQESV